MDSNIQLDEYIDFQKYWFVLKRRWIPATATFVGIVTLAVIKSLSAPEIYQAEAKILIKLEDRFSELIGLQDSSGELKGLTNDSDPLATEAEIVRTRPIIDKLIKELDLRDDEDKPLKYDDIAWGLSVTTIPGTDILQLTYADQDPEFATLVVNKASELYVEDHTLNNRSQTNAANQFIARQLPKVEANLKKAETELRNFKNQNRIASLNEETSANIDSLSRIASQIDEVEAELGNINASYNRLREQLGMNWQQAAAVSSLSESLAVQRVLEQLQEVKVTLAQKQNYLSERAPQIISLQEEEADLTALLERQIANTLSDQEQALVKNVNILSLGALKQEQLANFAQLGLEKAGLEKQLQTLRNTYNSYQQKSENLPRLQEQQRELERRVEASQSTYQTLLRKLQETQIAEQQNTGNVRIVSKAVVPEDPLPSNSKMIVAGAGVAGALLGVAVAFLLDLRDRTLKNTLEIEQMLPYPLVGVIPDYKKVAHQKQLLLTDSSTADLDLPELAVTNISVLPIREAYYNLQCNLQLLVNEMFNKVIVVTSAVSGEGKSSVAANLAIAKAQSGQKVLLVDGDLRYPTQHHLWKLFNDVGLTNVLNEEAKRVEWYDTVHQVMPNLDVITAGKLSKQPISLINSPLLSSFIVGAVSRFDCIIFDSPPVVGLADTKILGKLADGLLLVVRPGVANYGSVTTAKKILEARDFNLLGVVANGVDFDREPYGREYFNPNKKYLEAGTGS